MRRGRHRDATRLFTEAASKFRRLDMPLCAAVADRRLGELLGGRDGELLRDRADAWLTSRTIRRPDRVADVYAPGCARVERAAGDDRHFSRETLTT